MKHLFWLLTLLLLLLAFHFQIAPALERANVFTAAPLQNIPCVSYTPFRGEEAPWQLGKNLVIPAERFRDDLTVLANQGVKCVRTYAVTGMENFFPVAHELGFQIWFGIWIGADEAANEQELAKAREFLTRYQDDVRLVIVGNEVLLRFEQSAASLTAYISRVRAFAPDLTITYADVWEFWQKNPDVAQAVDLITIHILPYWENDPIPVERVGPHIEKIYQGVAEQFFPKPVALGELGWPSRGRSREAAVAGLVPEYQFTSAALDLCQKGGWLCNFIEAFDQPWKRHQEGGVGGAWGFWDANRVFKLSPPQHFPPDQIRLTQIAVEVGLILCALWFLSFGRASSLGKGLAALGLVVTTAAVSGFTLSDYLFYERSFAELCRFAVFWFVPILFLGATLAFLKDPAAFRHSPFWRRGITFLTSAHLLILGLVALEIAFDGRYRFFPDGTLLLLAVYVWIWRGLKWPGFGGQNPILFLMLAVCAVLVLVFEKFSNTEAVLFVSAILATLAAHGWPRFQKQDGRFLLGLVLAALAGYTLRVLWLQSTALGDFCSAHTSVWHCHIRSAVGYMMYWRLFGYAALASVGLSAFYHKNALRFFAAALAILALAFYNVSEGALALMLCLLLCWHRPFFRRGTACRARRLPDVANSEKLSIEG